MSSLYALRSAIESKDADEATRLMLQLSDATIQSNFKLFFDYVGMLVHTKEKTSQKNLQLNVLDVLERIAGIDVQTAQLPITAFETLTHLCDIYLKSEPVVADRTAECLIKILSKLENEHFARDPLVMNTFLNFTYRIVLYCSAPIPNKLRLKFVKSWKYLLTREAIPYKDRLRFLNNLAMSRKEMTAEDIQSMAGLAIPIWIRGSDDGEECYDGARFDCFISIHCWLSKDDSPIRPVIDFQVSAIRDITRFMESMQGKTHIPAYLNLARGVMALRILCYKYTSRGESDYIRFWGSSPTAHLTILRFAQLVLANKQALDNIVSLGAFLELTAAVLECFMEENPRAGMGIVKNGGIALVFEFLKETTHSSFVSSASFAKWLVICDSSHLPAEIASSTIADLVIRYDAKTRHLPRSPIWDEVIRVLLALFSAMMFHSPHVAAYFIDGTLTLDYIAVVAVALSNSLSAPLAFEWLVNLSSCSQARPYVAKIPTGLILHAFKLGNDSYPAYRLMMMWSLFSNMGKKGGYGNQFLDMNFGDFAAGFLVDEEALSLTETVLSMKTTTSLFLCALINVSCKNVRMKQAFHQNEVCAKCAKIINIFVDHRQVCELALWAIFNLNHDCPPPPGTDLASLANAIMNAFNKWQDDVRVSTRACKAIWTICSSRKFSQRAFDRLNAASTIRSCAASEPIKKAALKLWSQ